MYVYYSCEGKWVVSNYHRPVKKEVRYLKNCCHRAVILKYVQFMIHHYWAQTCPKLIQKHKVIFATLLRKWWTIPWSFKFFHLALKAGKLLAKLLGIRYLKTKRSLWHQVTTWCIKLVIIFNCYFSSVIKFCYFSFIIIGSVCSLYRVKWYILYIWAHNFLNYSLRLFSVFCSIFIYSDMFLVIFYLWESVLFK